MFNKQVWITTLFLALVALAGPAKALNCTSLDGKYVRVDSQGPGDAHPPGLGWRAPQSNLDDLFEK